MKSARDITIKVIAYNDSYERKLYDRKIAEYFALKYKYKKQSDKKS